MDESKTVESEPPFCVFLAEDDLDLRRLIAEVLRNDGHQVLEAGDGDTMLFRLVRFALDHRDHPAPSTAIVCDVRMPGCDGLTVLRNLREHVSACPPFILTTAFPEPAVLREADHLGAWRVLEKPFDLSELRVLIRQCAGRA